MPRPLFAMIVISLCCPLAAAAPIGKAPLGTDSTPGSVIAAQVGDLPDIVEGLVFQRPSGHGSAERDHIANGRNPWVLHDGKAGSVPPWSDFEPLTDQRKRASRQPPDELIPNDSMKADPGVLRVPDPLSLSLVLGMLIAACILRRRI